MAVQVNMKVKLRESAGKGANRKLRREGFTPAILYGNNVAEAPPTDFHGITRPSTPSLGACEPIYDTIIRSIGTQSSALNGSIQGRTSANGDTVVLTTGTFPDSVGEGDSIRVSTYYSYIQEKLSTTRALVQDSIYSDSSKTSCSACHRSATACVKSP